MCLKQFFEICSLFTFSAFFVLSVCLFLSNSFLFDIFVLFLVGA